MSITAATSELPPGATTMDIKKCFFKEQYSTGEDGVKTSTGSWKCTLCSKAGKGKQTCTV